MGEILSHAEVEAILSAIEPSRPVARDASAGPVSSSDAWERHDFRQPEPLQGAALKVAQALHHGICQRWKQRLAGLMQSSVAVHPVGACQSTATEFFKSAGEPFVTALVQHVSTAAESLLVWNRDLAQLLIARMLGGSDVQTACSAVDAMTDIELKLLTRLNEAVLGELGGLLGDSLSVAEVLQSVPDIPERTMTFPCAWFSFEVVAGEARGLIHLGIPSQSFSSAAPAGDTTRQSALQSIPAGIQQISVRISAALATLKLSAADLAALQVGDIVMTDKSPSETVALQLDGRSLCHATIGTHLGRKALRLTTDPGR